MSPTSDHTPPSMPPASADGAAADPAPAGEEDEFAGIPSPPRRRSWMAAFGVLLAVFLIFHQREDIGYALSSSSPRALGPAQELFAEGKAELPINRYVRVEGWPDFESGLSLDTQGQWQFRTLYRLMGTGGRLFVQRLPDPLPLALAERTAFSGRLIRLDSLSFDHSIREHYARRVTTTHVFTPETLVAAVASGAAPLTVRDGAGEVVAFSGNEPLEIELTRPDEQRVVLPRDERFWPEATARAALAKTGAQVLSGPREVFERTPGLEFDIRIPPESRTAVLSALADLAPELRLRPSVEHWQAPARSLVVENGRLVATAALPRTTGAAAPSRLDIDHDRVLAIRTLAPLDVPADALLLIEGERPADHYKVVVIAVFLAAFAIINLLALIKGA